MVTPLFMICSLLSASGAASGAPGIDARDKDQARARRSLTAATRRSQKDVAALQDKADVRYESNWATNAIRVDGGDSDLATQIASSPEIDSIWPTSTMTSRSPPTVRTSTR